MLSLQTGARKLLVPIIVLRLRASIYIEVYKALILTWPVPPCDHLGKRDGVEQGHCTLIAVKRYRDPHGLVDGIIFTA